VSGAQRGGGPGNAAGLLRRLRRLVELESPSDDEPRLRRLAAEFSEDLAGLGASIETREVDGVGTHVVGRLEGSDDGLAPIMVLGHLDTVHPVGSFEPVFRVEDGRAYGPGAFDMKGGWACMLEALDRSGGTGARRRPVLVLATCDEETGSATSRDLITDLAGNARAVLVMEPPFPDGGAKTRRKGVGWYRITVRGRASHAGLAPDRGVNAVLELAHQVLAVSSLEDRDAGTTVNVDLARGGTATNVIPASAWAEIDVRFTSMAEARRVDSGLRGLLPVLAGAGLEVDGGINRPPMTRTDGVAELYERARKLAEEAGWQLGEGDSGGASDGSLTAAEGVPTLDGIGPTGGGAHAADEHVIVDDLPRRVQLYRRLLETL
jgi:glutamate carboxypeptidase